MKRGGRKYRMEVVIPTAVKRRRIELSKRDGTPPGRDAANDISITQHPLPFNQAASSTGVKGRRNSAVSNILQLIVMPKC
ncbi:hypothetical protein AVEN_265327-1 [Araneus ventricosus]|uniref:Uncharacterized protein n=1 Tax=Araneus ventricosus TaxID=182803 RepID=A0A4Y2MPA9_ARAVE|nr:hypothetical protein AVEN_265327-1 [Araneus ventricosus]